MVPVVATWYHWLAWKKCVLLLYPNGWTSIILHHPIWSRHQDNDFTGGVPVLRYSHYFFVVLKLFKIDHLNESESLHHVELIIGTCWHMDKLCFYVFSEEEEPPKHQPYPASLTIPCFHITYLPPPVFHVPVCSSVPFASAPRCNWWGSFDCSWRHRPRRNHGGCRELPDHWANHLDSRPWGCFIIYVNIRGVSFITYVNIRGAYVHIYSTRQKTMFLGIQCGMKGRKVWNRCTDSWGSEYLDSVKAKILHATKNISSCHFAL